MIDNERDSFDKGEEPEKMIPDIKERIYSERIFIEERSEIITVIGGLLLMFAGALIESHAIVG